MILVARAICHRIFHQIGILGKSNCESRCNRHSPFPVWSAVISQDSGGVRCFSLMTLIAFREVLSESGTSTFHTWRSRTPVVRRSAPCGLGYQVPRNIADSSSDESDIAAISPRGITLIPRRIKISRSSAVRPARNKVSVRERCYSNPLAHGIFSRL